MRSLSRVADDVGEREALWVGQAILRREANGAPLPSCPVGITPPLFLINGGGACWRRPIRSQRPSFWQVERMTDEDAAKTPPAERELLFFRPRDQLLALPLRYRWEFSRRNPYYLEYWQLARTYRATGPTNDDASNMLGMLAVGILHQIGVSGDPVDPATRFEELEVESADPAFLSGAIQPMTYRNMLTHFIGAFPLTDLAVIGNLLRTAAHREYQVEGDDPHQNLQRMRALEQLNSLQSKTLDSYFDGPLVYINVEASQRSIQEAIELFVRRLKERRRIGETRLHTSKLDGLLEVWDRHEGWTGSGYDVNSEQPFAMIAGKLGLAKSTVIERYQSAFQWVTGHAFAAAPWIALLAAVKLAGKSGTLPHAHRVRWSRLQQANSSQLVSETLLTPGKTEGRSGVIEQASAVSGSNDVLDVLIDIDQLLGKGLSNEAICEKLGFEATDVAYLRKHREEHGSLL